MALLYWRFCSLFSHRRHRHEHYLVHWSPWLFFLLLLCFYPRLSRADATPNSTVMVAPNIPGCGNKFKSVMVKYWVDGKDGTSSVGLNAQFGSPLPSRESDAIKMKLALANPFTCCGNVSSKMAQDCVMTPAPSPLALEKECDEKKTGESVQK